MEESVGIPARHSYFGSLVNCHARWLLSKRSKGLRKCACGWDLEMVPQRFLSGPLLHEDQTPWVFRVLVNGMRQAAWLLSGADDMLLAQRESLGSAAFASDYVSEDEDHVQPPVGH